MKRADREDAAAMFVAIVQAVARGDITANTPQERRMVRRIEGAAAALRAHDDRVTFEEP